jgi:hypothetical protein
MALDTGADLLQKVAERILGRYLTVSGYPEVTLLRARPLSASAPGVDLMYRTGDEWRKIKVKPDVYFGTDPAKVNDRYRTFYRADSGHYAFESISNNATRESGWTFNSDADEVYYYYLALSQTEEEIGALLGEPDGIFFSELKVDRDELHILPMAEVQSWFQQNYDQYTPRPVTVGGHSAWYRLVPRSDISRHVAGIKVIGSVFPAVARA